VQLLCPKCHNVMHQYVRNSVVVDQCTECKGLFLDRGELEKLVDAESAWYGGSGEQPVASRPPRDPRFDERRRYDDDDDRRRYDERRRHDDDDHYRHPHSKKHRRRSFLEELFD
jgi:uncharacterized protein